VTFLRFVQAGISLACVICGRVSDFRRDFPQQVAAAVYASIEPSEDGRRHLGFCFRCGFSGQPRFCDAFNAFLRY
jgi:hypothetical protein